MTFAGASESHLMRGEQKACSLPLPRDTWAALAFIESHSMRPFHLGALLEETTILRSNRSADRTTAEIQSRFLNCRLEASCHQPGTATVASKLPSTALLLAQLIATLSSILRDFGSSSGAQGEAPTAVKAEVHVVIRPPRGPHRQYPLQTMTFSHCATVAQS
jgi:hypothetical protein